MLFIGIEVETSRNFGKCELYKNITYIYYFPKFLKKLKIPRVYVNLNELFTIMFFIHVKI